MKIAIADDERLIRFSISDMIREISDTESLYTSAMYEAENGKELLQIVEEFHPDIAFVDIRMPGLNGLEVIEKGRVISPNTFWVILTGYAEFSYAKQAITLGAFDYLVKPASLEDMRSVLLRIQKLLYENYIRDSLELEIHISRIMQDIVTEELDPYFSGDSWYSGTLIIQDYAITGAGAIQLEHGVYEIARSILTDEAFQTGQASIIGGKPPLPSLIASQEGFPVCVIQADSPEAGTGLLELFEPRILAEPAMERLKTIGTSSLTLYHIQPVKGLVSFLASVSEILLTRSLRLLSGVNTVYNNSSSFLREYSEAELEFAAHIDELLSTASLGTLEYLEYYNYLMKQESLFFQLWEKSSLSCFLALKTGYDRELLRDNNSAKEYIQWLSLQPLHQEQNSETVRRQKQVAKALDVIHEYFQEEIGLAQIAEKMDLTPNYLSSEFHRVMGVTFTQYLTSLRMEKSKEMLEQGNMTVKEVASSVGFVSSRHFAKLFKQKYGINPSSYNNK